MTIENRSLEQIIKRNEKILEFLSKEGYTDLKIVGDDEMICGLYQYIYTFALLIDLDNCGWGIRYCFKTKGDALLALHLFDGKTFNGEHDPPNFTRKMMNAGGGITITRAADSAENKTD